MLKQINKVAKILIASDFFLNLGWGLLAPVFAIFILEKITAGNIVQATKIAGFSALVYWITKSFLEIPIGYFLDKKEGEKDDFWLMNIGIFIMAFVPLGYLFSSQPWHIYLFQMIHAAGMSMALPSWLAIFTRHIDKKKEAFEWGMESTSISIGAGIAGGLGGVMAAYFGFKIVFLLVSFFTFLCGILQLFIKNDIFVRDGKLGATVEKPVIEP